jgi:hypothetical protein
VCQDVACWQASQKEEQKVKPLGVKLSSSTMNSAWWNGLALVDYFCIFLLCNA